MRFIVLSLSLFVSFRAQIRFQNGMFLYSPDGAPRIGIALGLVDRIAICQKGLVDLADGGVATSQEVERVAGFVVRFDRLLQILDGL